MLNRYPYSNCHEHSTSLILVGVELSNVSSPSIEVEIYGSIGNRIHVTHNPKITGDDFIKLSGGIISLWIIGSLYDCVEIVIAIITDIFNHLN